MSRLLAFSEVRRWAVAVLATFASLQFVGCASTTLPAPSGTAGNVQTIKSANAAQMVAGEFKAEPGNAASADRGLSVRGVNMISPAGGSFAIQLRDQLAAELKAAGLYDANAKVVISGTMTENEVDAGISTGSARIAARFEVARDGKVVFNKEITAASTWESSFIGAIAVPAAANNYGALYADLIGKLLGDPDFRASVRR